MRLVHPDKQQELSAQHSQVLKEALLVLGQVKDVFECCFAVGQWARGRVSFEAGNQDSWVHDV
jgi:hypothetical protein